MNTKIVYQDGFYKTRVVFKSFGSLHQYFVKLQGKLIVSF